MEYVQSSSGKWHKTDCQYSPDDDEGEAKGGDEWARERIWSN
ncbi:hypothetical protein [Halorientalis sp. IM1011]|nr:hypothetical protein [Halorientalis sp. IM1011]